MSGGAGNAMDMINRMRQNRAMRASKRDKFKENNQKGIYSKKTDLKVEYDFPEISEKDLEHLKSEIREKVQRENKKQILIMLFGVIICFTIIILFIKYY